MDNQSNDPLKNAHLLLFFSPFLLQTMAEIISTLVTFFTIHFISKLNYNRVFKGGLTTFDSMHAKRINSFRFQFGGCLNMTLWDRTKETISTGNQEMVATLTLFFKYFEILDVQHIFLVRVTALNFPLRDTCHFPSKTTPIKDASQGSTLNEHHWRAMS